MSIDSQVLISGVKKYPIPVLCGALSLAVMVLLYFRSDLQASQQADLKKYSAESARYRANISNSVQLQEQLDFLIQANQAIKERSLSAEGLAQNLQYFYRLETEIGIKADLRPGARPTPIRAAVGGKAVPGKKATPPNYVALNYIISVKGDFDQLITFLRRLEQGVYFCRINTASAAPSGSGMTLNLNLDLLGTP